MVLWLGVDTLGFELQFYYLSALRPWPDRSSLSLGFLIYKEEQHILHIVIMRIRYV